MGVACLWPQRAAGQQMQTIPNFRQLPGPVVRKIVQDEEGFMWYATTESGLCRDNGYQIEFFVGDSAAGFSRADRFVNEISPTRDHRILFSTHTGAWLLDKRDYRIERLDTTVTVGRSVQSILQAHDGTFWLSSGTWVYHFDKERRLMRSFEITEGGRHQPALTLYEDSSGRLWLLLHEGGLRLYNARRDDFEPCRWDYVRSPLVMAEDARHQCLWIGTVRGGIVRLNVSDQAPRQTRTTSFGVTRGHSEWQRGLVVGLCLQDSLLWAATMDNLYCYAISDSTLRPHDTSYFLPKSRKVVERPCLDRGGNLWVPSFTPNPFVIKPVATDLRRFAVEKMEAQTDYPLIADVVEPEAGGYWILQSRIGIMYHRPEDDLLATATDDPSISVYVTDFLVRAAGGGVWTKDDRRLLHARLDGRRIVVTTAAEFDSSINYICRLNDGRLLVSTEDEIWQLSRDGGDKRCLASGLPGVIQITQTADGEIYFLSQRMGLARLADDGRPTSLCRDYDFDLLAAGPDHRLWLSSPNGVVASYHTLERTLAVDSLISDPRRVVKHLHVDASGHVWLLTSIYVREYSPKSHSFRTFRTTDSNVSMDYMQDLKVAAGNIVFCGAGAICSVKSSPVLEQISPLSRPVATDIAVDGRRHHITYGHRDFELQPAASQVIVYLTTFDHLNADKCTFAYRLQGEGGDAWNYLPTGLNGVPLSNLARGVYHLEVRVADEQGRWSDAAEVLTLRRLPAWWETWWAYIIYVALAAALLVLGFRWLLRQGERRHAEEMEQRLTDMKFRFFTNVSHELRTPLTLIITPLTSLVSQQPEGELRTKLNSILGHAQELLQLINNLLSFRKLEMGQTKLNLRYGDLVEFVREACTSFQALYDKKGISLRYVTGADTMNVRFDKYILHHVLFNLLSNAQKFTPRGGDVCVTLSRQDDSIRIAVADTGCGIPAEQLPHIFERFYQGDAASGATQEGSGIGLNMARELLTIHGGTISVLSKVDEGSTFTVEIRDGLNTEPAQEEGDAASSEGQDIAASTPASVAQKRAGEAATTIMLVEDNDEFRQFVAAELKRNFRVLEAADGQAALALVQAEQVDVVVSDVMMPGIDGLELCRRLKGDEQTSHIPVILLTARAAQESELEGYQAGADYYITKPFDIAILLGRLNKIEQDRQRRSHELIQQLESPDVQQIFSADRDKELMQRVIDLLSQHLSDENYGRYELSADLCMTYITAYRKIKALTGLAPAEFIRNYRLKQACVRLRNTQLSILEVAAEVGFPSPSYFSIAFAKEFGQTPSEYRRANHDLTNS